jgi:hypothetical protein
MTAADMVQALSLYDRLQDHRRERYRAEFDRDRGKEGQKGDDPNRDEPAPEGLHPDDPKIAQIKPVDERETRRR